MDFGCAYNFFGGPGESHHRYFLKQPGANTQRQWKLFVQQSTERVYETLALEIASEAEKRKGDQFDQIGNLGLFEHNHQQSFEYSGKYTLVMKGAKPDATFKEFEVVWHSDRGKKKQKSKNHKLHSDLLRIIAQKVTKKGLETFSLVGYTAMTTQFEDRTHIFCANPYYKESPRYDWAYVEYAEKTPGQGQQP